MGGWDCGVSIGDDYLALLVLQDQVSLRMLQHLLLHLLLVHPSLLDLLSTSPVLLWTHQIIHHLTRICGQHSVTLAS